MTDLPTNVDWETEYNNRKRVPGHPAIIEGWATDSARYREVANAELGVAYGPGARNVYDLFHPGDGEGDRVHLFIHGGYWQGLDNAFFSFAAKGLNARGATVAACTYTLCPEGTVAGIADEMRQCVAHLWRRFGRPMTVSGHSAGGHLVAELLSTDWNAVDSTLPAVPVTKGVAVSGLFDLRPLCHTSINAALGLDEARARASSPAFREPTAGVELVTFVGEIESSEFHRQCAIIADAWRPKGVPVSHHVTPGADHFTVVADYADPASALVEACL